MKCISEVYWDKGARPGNQDSVSLQEVRICGKKVLFALVCDGIGGLQEGEVASGLVAERMTEWFYGEGVDMLRCHKSRKKIKKAGFRALYGCNEELRDYGAKKDLKLGTTITMLLLWDKKYMLWHSGDTRAYCIRSPITGRRRYLAKIKQLTKDHTINNHTLIRCIGSFAWKEPENYSGRIRGRSTFLLCSDGFRNQISEERLGEALQPSVSESAKQLRGCLKELAEYAKRQGEQDNLSAVAIRID